MTNTATAPAPLLATPQGSQSQADQSIARRQPLQLRRTYVPDIFFDEIMSELSGGETKVFCYMIRRICGFNKAEKGDAISYSQFLNGIKSREGHQIDFGAGVSSRTLTRALDSLEQRGLITRLRRHKANGSPDTTHYQINFLPQTNDNPKRNFASTPPRKITLDPPRKITYTTDSILQETVKQHTVESANADVCGGDSESELELDQINQGGQVAKDKSTLIEKPVSISKAGSRSKQRVRTIPPVAAAPPFPTVTSALVEPVDPANAAIVEALIEANVPTRRATNLADLIVIKGRDLAYVENWVSRSLGKNNPIGYLINVLENNADLPSNGRPGQNQPFQPVRVQDQPQDKIIAGYSIPAEKIGLWDDPKRLPGKLRALDLMRPQNEAEAAQIDYERKMFHAILEKVTGQRFDPRTGKLLETTEPTKPAESGVRVIDNTLKQHLERIDHQAARYLRHLQIEHDTVKIQFFGNAVADFDCDFFLECLQGVYPNISRVELI